MQSIKLPSREDLRRIFNYLPEQGVLLWNYRPEMDARWNNRFAGSRAGNVTARGYVQVCIDGQSFLAHRIIWKWLHDEEPPEVDHRDTDPSNNSQLNLRASTRSQNLANRGARKGKLLPKGVVLTAHGRYCAQIGGDHIGNFATAEEAGSAFEREAQLRYGDFARAS